MLRIIITSVFMLSACGTLGEPTTEEKAQQKAKVAALKKKLDRDTTILVDTAVTPILNLIDASIIYYEEKEKWPVFNGVPGDKSHYRGYQVTGVSKDTLTSEFQLKTMKFDWVLELKRTDRKDEGKNLYIVNLYGAGTGSGFTGGIRGLKATRGISKTEEMKKKSFARMLAIMGNISEHLSEKAPDKPTPVLETVATATIGVLICTVFDVPPGQCSLNMGAPKYTGDGRNKPSDEKDKVKANLEKRLKDLMKSDM